MDASYPSLAYQLDARLSYPLVVWNLRQTKSPKKEFAGQVWRFTSDGMENVVVDGLTMTQRRAPESHEKRKIGENLKERRQIHLGSLESSKTGILEEEEELKEP